MWKSIADTDVVNDVTHTRQSVSLRVLIRARGYKTLFMLNSVEHKIFPASKC